MYNTHIQTTITIRGFVVFIEYYVTAEWAVEWWLNQGAYEIAGESQEIAAGIELLETMLRVYEHDHIASTLISEFEHRQYAQEQAEAALLSNEDIPF